MNRKNIIKKVCKKYGRIEIKKDKLSFVPYALNINNGYVRHGFDRDEMDGRLEYMCWDYNKWNGDDVVDKFIIGLLGLIEKGLANETTDVIESIKIMYRQWVFWCIYNDLLPYALHKESVAIRVRAKLLQRILENNGYLEIGDGEFSLNKTPFKTFHMDDGLEKYFELDLSEVVTEQDLWNVLRNKYISKDWVFDLPLEERKSDYALKTHYLKLVNEMREKSVENLMINMDVVFGFNSINKEEYIAEFFEKLKIITDNFNEEIEV